MAQLEEITQCQHYLNRWFSYHDDSEKNNEIDGKKVYDGARIALTLQWMK